MNRVWGGFGKQGYLLGYFSEDEVLSKLDYIVRRIDSLKFDGRVLPQFKGPSSDPNLYLDKIQSLLSSGFKHFGEYRDDKLCKIDSDVIPNWYSKKTESGWHWVGLYNLGDFTRNDFYEEKYAIILYTQFSRHPKGGSWRENIKERLIVDIEPGFALNTLSHYFHALNDGRLRGRMNVTIDQYLGNINYFRDLNGLTEGDIEKLPCLSFEKATDRLYRLQISKENEGFDYESAKKWSIALGKNCISDLPLND